MKIRILSYNIHRAIGVDRRFRPARIEDIIAGLDPDIALLQEVDEGVPRSRELDLARELARGLGFDHFAIGHNVALRKGRYGNATLSRHPILRERNIDLTVGGRKRRGCQHTRIEVRSGARRSRLEVFNLHLGLSTQERSHQMALLARSSELASLPADVACVMGGDFNDWRSRLEPVLAGAFGFRPAVDLQSRRVFATFPSFLPRASLDRVYYRGQLRLLSARRGRQQLCRVASDHLPVVVDFEIH